MTVILTFRALNGDKTIVPCKNSIYRSDLYRALQLKTMNQFRVKIVC